MKFENYEGMVRGPPPESAQSKKLQEKETILLGDINTTKGKDVGSSR